MSSIKRKFLALLAVGLGVFCCLVVPFFYRLEPLSLEGITIGIVNSFIINNCPVIMTVNGGIGFIALGILTYIGILIPAYSYEYKDYDNLDYEKAKVNFFSVTAFSPFLYALSVVVIYLGESTMYKVLWTLFIGSFIYYFIVSFRVLFWDNKNK